LTVRIAQTATSNLRRLVILATYNIPN